MGEYWAGVTPLCRRLKSKRKLEALQLQLSSDLKSANSLTQAPSRGRPSLEFRPLAAAPASLDADSV